MNFFVELVSKLHICAQMNLDAEGTLMEPIWDVAQFFLSHLKESTLSGFHRSHSQIIRYILEGARFLMSPCSNAIEIFILMMAILMSYSHVLEALCIAVFMFNEVLIVVEGNMLFCSYRMILIPFIFSK